MAKFEDKHTIMDAICLLMSQGKSLSYICSQKTFPTRETIYAWMLEDAALSDKYARACEMRAEGYVEEIILIADTAIDPVKARLQVDARKWIASKMLPKKYGDKLDLNATVTERTQVIDDVPPAK